MLVQPEEEFERQKQKDMGKKKVFINAVLAELFQPVSSQLW